MSDSIRMKEVLARTGLTDRAVRLYIDTGLLTPRQESSYSGRKTILFSEEDVQRLEVIATLRKAGFSLADIHTMQEYPERTGEVLTQFCRTLEKEIGQKEEILRKLSAIPVDQPLTDQMIADGIRASAAAKPVPREDSALFFGDLRVLIRSRISSVLSLLFLVLGAAVLFPLVIKTAFAIPKILVGGGVKLDYEFTSERFFTNIGGFIAAVLLLFAVVFVIVYLAGGRRAFQISALVLTVLTAVTLLLLPAEVKEQLFLFEFIGYRHSFMYSLLYWNRPWFDTLLQSLKFIPLLLGAVCTAIGIAREEDV